jgi:hypothetical protein
MDDELTAAYLAGYHEAKAETKRLKAQNAELLSLVDYALEVSVEGLPLGKQWKEKARAAIAKARGEK